MAGTEASLRPDAKNPVSIARSAKYTVCDFCVSAMGELRDNDAKESASRPLSPEEVMQQLQRIVTSQVFLSARRSRMFLQYVVERSLLNSAPKEYEIALEVLGRATDYNPDIDATVRVEAGRLRSRLREYYATAGESDAIFIEMPKGAYQAVFRWREAVPSSSPGPAIEPFHEQQDSRLDPQPSCPEKSSWRRLLLQFHPRRQWKGSLSVAALAVMITLSVIALRPMHKVFRQRARCARLRCCRLRIFPAIAA
jgi:hypothetical protein